MSIVWRYIYSFLLKILEFIKILIGRIMALTDTHILILRNHDSVTSHSKRDYTNVNKGTDFEVENYSIIPCGSNLIA